MNLNDYNIVSLSEMLGRYGDEKTLRILSAYRSVHDSMTESFLKDVAVNMEKRDICRTYLAFSDDQVSIIGYITLSIKCMTVPQENLLSGSTLRKMNIESGTGVAQSYLLGQLSRSAEAPKGMGVKMLDTAFDILESAKELVGCRMVRLDCLDELVPYYSDHGFKLVTTNKTGNLNQMMAII